MVAVATNKVWLWVAGSMHNRGLEVCAFMVGFVHGSMAWGVGRDEIRKKLLGDKYLAYEVQFNEK